MTAEPAAHSDNRDDEQDEAAPESIRTGTDPLLALRPSLSQRRGN